MSLWLACCASLCLKPSPWLIEKARRDLGWLHPICHKRTLAGFTLAELLIALAILGVIATFTIPKIMAGQQNTQKNAAAKEVASMIGSAYQAYTAQNGSSSSFTLAALTPYLNYANIDTSSTLLDDHPLFNGGYDCSSNSTCLKMHNGGTLFWTSSPPVSFGGTANNNAVYFLFDPDGVKGTSGASDGPSKSVCFFLYYNGFVTSRPYIISPSISSNGARGPAANTDPSWFSW